ncbi:MAG: DUF3079 domain-containing protein [Aquincola sp.]|nr:DUF3079 domain-containing protein [Aquincola sp.]
MAKKLLPNPAQPECLCWRWDRYCSADAMTCGNGSIATLHPAEFFYRHGFKWSHAVPAE